MSVKLSIVIPVYNERDHLARLVERVQAAPLPAGVEREIVLVDDGSSDGTTQMLDQYEGQPGVVVYRSAINLGKGVAVRIGFAKASGDIMLVQDADLEYDPNDYPSLLEPILQGETDIVFGSRFLGKMEQMHFLHVFGNKMLNITNNFLFKAELTDCYTCYKVFRRHCLNGIKLKSHGFELEAELTAKFEKKGYRILELPIRYIGRTALEGKKIRKLDGFLGVLNLLYYRFCD